MTRAADGVHVRYAASAQLVVYGSNRLVGFELCGADDACRFVDATLSQNEVVLSSAGASDLKVRFCWADSPVCNIYGPAGLPAVPFEAEIR